MIKLIRLFQYLLLILFLFVGIPAYFQNATKQKTKENSRFSLGGGFARSHMENKYEDDVFAKSLEFKTYLNIVSSFRLVANVENQLKFDLRPRWSSVKNINLDLQSHFLGYFANGQGDVYGIGGFTLQRFSGYYSGFGNIIHLKEYIGKKYSTYYYGVVIGVGIERIVLKNLWIWGEIRVRMIWNNESTAEKKDPTLSDQLCLGLKLNLPAFKKIFRGLGDKYHWF